MRVTFDLPPAVMHSLRSHIPAGQRSGFLADLISKNLAGKGNALEQAARKANALKKVSREMKEWRL